MSKLTIQAKMLLLTAVFALGLGGFVAVVTSTTASKLEDSDYAAVVEMKDVLADVLPPPLYVLEAWSVTSQMMLSEDKVQLTALETQWRQLEKDQRTRQEFWNQHLNQQTAKPYLAEADQNAARFFNIGDTQLLAALEAGDKPRAQTAYKAMADAYSLQRGSVDKVVEFANKASDQDVSAASSRIAARKSELAIIGLVVAVLGGALGFAIARGVARRMQVTVELLARVADGDLSERLDVDVDDEIGTMAKALNRAFDSVSSVLGRVQSAALELSSTATSLSESAEQISSGAQQQASSLEETAASLEEITATVRQSSGNAQQASQLAESSRDVATKGGGVVTEAVTAMTEVTRSSRRIGDIITTIDEIALQTNLLALNAAVEAARAGEQGRGFAVVAAEVGSLAQRSAAAAKEVKSLIEDTLERVELGHSLVGRSGEALTEIITSVKRVTDIVGEIASASREQSAGVEQVNQAVTQMDQVTQNNAVQTDELSQTASALSSTAAELTDLVSRFRLSSDQREPAEREPQAPRRRAEAPRRKVARSTLRPPRLPKRAKANGHWPTSVDTANDDDVETL
jgi:methyl-accepting chemotaxis protein